MYLRLWNCENPFGLSFTDLCVRLAERDDPYTLSLTDPSGAVVRLNERQLRDGRPFTFCEEGVGMTLSLLSHEVGLGYFDLSTSEDQPLLPDQIARIAARWYIDGVDELILQVESSKDQSRISSKERKEVIDAFIRLWSSDRRLPLLAIDGEDVNWELVTR